MKTLLRNIKDKLFSNAKHKLFINLMISYILILIAAVLIGIFGYGEASKIVEKDIKNANLSILNQSKDIMDEKLSAISMASTQIATNPIVLDMQDEIEDEQGNFYIDMINVVKELSNYKLNLDRDFIYDYYVYIKNSNYLVNSETVYKTDFYYNSVVKNISMSFSDWTDNVLNKKHNGDFYPDTLMEFDNHQKISTIMYMQSIPLSINKDSTGTFVVLINKVAIDKLFSGVDISKGGWIYIQDNKGNVITSICNKGEKISYIDLKKTKNSRGIISKSIENKKMLVSYTTSSNNGWKYVAVLPNNVVMDKLNNFQRLIFLIILVTVIIGVFIAYYLAYYNSKPVNKIFSQILGEDESKYKGDVYSTINSTISTLISSNKSLQEKMEQQKPILLDAFVGRLLKGEFNNINEVEVNSEYIGTNITGEQYTVLVLRIYDRNDVNEVNQQVIQELNTIKVLLKDTLTRHFDGKTYYHDMVDPQSMAVIIYGSKEIDFKKQISSVADNIFEEFIKLYSLKMLIGIGNIYNSVLEVWRSYQEALETINYVQLYERGKIKWYEEIPTEVQSYYYPIDFEHRIINYVKSGEAEQIKKLFDIIYDENYNKRELSVNMKKQLFYEIKSTIVKLMQQIPKDDRLIEKIKELNFENDDDHNYERLISIFDNMCNNVVENKSDRNLTVINKIVNFINKNYMKQDLSLTMVASEFHFSEGYLSYFFKEQTNQNFTDFVEQVRMQEACSLLKNTQMNIDEIAMKIGYNSVQSFRRAFKRLKGVSPSTIRTEQ